MHYETRLYYVTFVLLWKKDFFLTGRFSFYHKVIQRENSDKDNNNINNEWNRKSEGLNKWIVVIIPIYNRS